MRLLVKLRAMKDQAYDLKYHHKLQGFIYGLLDGTPHVKLHDKRGDTFQKRKFTSVHTLCF